MIKLLMLGFASAAGIGTLIALITTWLGGNRLSRWAGLILVAVLCLAYHALAWFAMFTPSLNYLIFTIIVPVGFGFGEGDLAFVLAILAQATLAAVIGMGAYWSINRKRLRDQLKRAGNP